MKTPPLLAVGGLLATISVAQAYTNLAEAYSAMGFNPSAPGNATAVMFSDPHMNLAGNGTTPGLLTTNLDLRLVSQVNAMNPPPTKMFVLGDESSTYSTCPGQLPDWPRVKAYGSNEMQLWLAAIEAFTNIVRTNIVWIPGNHDQDPRETNAELFCQMFPGMPPYQMIDLCGVRFLLLNGGNQNFPNAPQTEWIREQLALTSPTQTVAVLIHQPPFAYSRGNSIMLRELFQNWPFRWWLFHGHAHYYGQVTFDIGRSNLAETAIGSVNTNEFNGQTSSPGFMVLCLSNGIAGRIYHHFLDGSFDVMTEPEWRKPLHYSAVFEDVDGLLWRREKNPGVMPEVVLTNIAYDEGYYYAYVTEVQWALPLARHGNLATHFLMVANMDDSASFSFSADRTNWIDVPIPPRTNYLYPFPIPPSIACLPNAYARVHFAGEAVEGWGLATTNPPPWITFPQLASVPPQSTVAGRVFSVTNVAIDPYAPPDLLSFTLLSGPPGATLDPSNGRFHWQPPIANAPETVPVTIKVADNGSRPMCATQQFFISVTRPVEPVMSPPCSTSNGWVFNVSGDTGLAYTVWASTNLQDWTILCKTNAAMPPFAVTDCEAATMPNRFYRTVVGPAALTSTNGPSPWK